MNKNRLTMLALLTLVFAGSGAPAMAQPARVFVSTRGNDTRVCASVRRPCRTLAAAIARVRAGGDVIVVRTGTYGGALVDKSVTIGAAPGVSAIVQQPLVVSPGSDGSVVLRGLSLRMGADDTAVWHESGRLHVERSNIEGGGRGIYTRPSAGDLLVTDTTILDVTAEALRVDAANQTFVEDSRFENARINGLFVGGAARVTLNRSAFVLAGEFGLTVSADALLRASHCLFAENDGAGVTVDSPNADVTIEDSEIVNNVDLAGLAVTAGTVRLSNSTVAGNLTGLIQRFGGVLESYGNNRIRGNTFDTFGTITVVPLR